METREMNTAEALTILQSRDFLDKLYSFSYHRCDSSHEAEDLCSDIVLAVLSTVQKQEKIDSFYAFVWAIARRVYADYSEKRNKARQIISLENKDELLSFPYLSKQKDTGLLMWTILSRICWDLHKRVQWILQEKYFSDIVPVQRPFSCAAVAFEGDRRVKFR